MNTPNENDHLTEANKEAIAYVGKLFLTIMQDSRKEAPEDFNAADISIAVLAVHMLIERDMLGGLGILSYPSRVEYANSVIEYIGLQACTDEADERIVNIDPNAARH